MKPSLALLLLLAAPALAGDTKAELDVRAVRASDAPLSDAQAELLDVAFKAASALPVMPHARDKARAQQAVIDACLQLDQPDRAAGWLEQIGNWRRGAAHADLALWLAQHGAADACRKHLDEAAKIAEMPEGDDGQAWHRDRIRAGIARTLAWLGEPDEAARYAEGLAAAESGRVLAEQAQRQPDEAFDGALGALANAAKGGDFDGTRAAQASVARLFERYYADVERRDRAEAAMKASWNRLPLTVRIDLLADMARAALAHGDQAKALQLVREAQDIVHSAPWNPQDHVPLLARLGGLAAQAGDTEGARRDVDAARALYETTRESIVDIERSKALRPVAEAYQVLGDSKAALDVYAQAVEEGVHNPNSRPRAEDLSATCSSMAVAGVRPDAELLARIRAVADALGPPW